MPISQLELDEAIALSDQNPNDLELAEAAITIADSFQFEKQQRQEATRTIFTDPNHGFSSDQLSELTNMVNGDEERKYKLLNKRYFQELGGIPKDQVDSNIDQLINAYGLQEYNTPISSHKEFFDSIKADFLAQDQVADMAREFSMSKASQLDAELQFRERMASVPGYAGREGKWKDEFFRFKGAFDNKRDQYSNSIWLLSNGLERKNLEDTVSPVARFSKFGGTEEPTEAQLRRRQEISQSPSNMELAEVLMEVPAEDRPFVISAAVADAAKDGRGRKDILLNLADSVERGFSQYVEGFPLLEKKTRAIGIKGTIRSGFPVSEEDAATPEAYFKAATSQLTTSTSKGLSEFGDILPTRQVENPAQPSEEVKAGALKLADRLIEAADLTTQIRNAAEQDVDPITSDSVAMRGIYALARSTPYMAAAALPGGAFVNTAAFVEQGYQMVRSMNPNMTAEQAMGIGVIAAPFMTFIERMQLKGATGQLKSVNRFFNEVIATPGGATSRFLARTTLTAGAELVQENVQDVTPFMVQGIISAVSEDMPNVPVELLYKDMVAQQPELFFAVLPLAIMGGGAGTYSDFRNGRALLSSYDELRAQGLSEAASADIRALATRGDYDGAQSLLREEFKTLGKDQVAVQEARAKALPKLIEEYKAQQAALDSGIELDILPAILQQRDGKVALRYTDGQEVQYDSHAQAMERFDSIASSAVLKLHRDMITAAKMTTSQMGQGREVKLIISPLDLTTTELEEQGVASAEQLQKRKEIADVDKGITPKAEEAKARALTGISANSSEARKAASYVLGSSVNAPAAPDSFGDRVIRTTARVYKQANPYTVIEEVAEGDIKFMLTEGRVERPWIISALRQWESQMGDALFRKSITDDSQVENQDIVEAYSKMVVSYFAGRATAGDQGRIFSKQFRSEIAKALRMDMNAVLTGYASLFEAVYRRAGMIEKARKEGTLPADLESFLAKSAGMSPQKVFEREVVKEGEGIARELQRGPQLDPQVTVVEEGEDFRRTMLPDGSIIEGPATLSIISFHGTPHEIPLEEGFRMDKVGTGEGAQAYGYGLYFAEAKEVATIYQKMAGSLSDIKTPDGKTVPLNDAPNALQAALKANLGAPDIMKNAMNFLKGWNGSFFRQQDGDQSVDDAIAMLEQMVAQGVTQALSGNFYTVELLPDADEFLDWDKPLSKQSEKVRAALVASGYTTEGDLQNPESDATVLGREFYKARAALEGSPKSASERLLAAGIPGIRYLDGDSRIRPYKEIKKDFLSALPENAEIEDVEDAIAAGAFKPNQIVFLNALKADDWLGFEFPAQAISAALSDNISNWDASSELIASIDPLRGDITYNYVIFDEKLIKILEENGTPVASPTDAGTTLSVMTSEIPVNRMRRLMQQIDAMYSTGRTEGVENLEAELEILLDKADSDLEGMDENDDADQVGEMLSSDIAEVDSANPSPEEELINQWYRWTGKGAAYDGEELRETYPTFGAFVRAATGDNAYVVQPGVTDEQIEEAAKESVANYERRRTAMLRSRVDKVTFSTITPAVDAEYLALAADPEKNQARLQEMVDGAARAAGLKVLYHGTTKEDASKIKASGFLRAAREPAVYLTTDPNGGSYGDGEIGYGDGTVLRLAVDESAIEIDDEFPDGREDYRAEIGYKGRLQIKSADPVTYDESGNIIPLSQRFNPRRDEISFSTVTPGGIRFDEIAKEDPINDGSRVGTAWQGKRNPTTQDTNDGIATVVPKELEKQMKMLTHFVDGVPLPAFITKFINPEEKMRAFIEFQKGNLLALYDAFEKLSRNYVVRSTHWYDGARLIAEGIRDASSVTVEQAAAIIAVFSPMKDWFQNVAMAQRFADVMANHKIRKITQSEMGGAMQTMLDATEDPETIGQIFEKIEGNSITDLLNDRSKAGRKIASVAVRLVSQHVHGLDHDVLSPEGESLGVRLNRAKGKKAPERKKLVWQSYTFIEKAISIYEDGSLNNISKVLGTEHKIRNFYNNIVSPTSPYGDATVDTHAVNAAVLFPMGNKGYLVGLNFGDAGVAGGGNSGLYWIFHEALREAAAERGVSPRQMQSITWEAIRGLFTDVRKRDKNFIATITKIWEDAKDANTARSQIVDLGITPPEWARVDLGDSQRKGSMGGDQGKITDSTGSVRSGVRQGGAGRDTGAGVGTTLSTITAIGDIDSKFAAMFSPFQRSPELRAKLGLAMREKALAVQQKIEPISREFKSRIAKAELEQEEILSKQRSKAQLDREEAAREGVEYGRLLEEYFNADTEAKQAALPATDRTAARSEAKRLASRWRAEQDREQARLKTQEAEARGRLAESQISDTAKSRLQKELERRDSLIGFLRTLDAIQRALPVEVRGKIGGFVALAELSTPAAMLEEIERRVQKIDVELERYLKKEATSQVKKFFKSVNKSKNTKAGEVAKGNNNLPQIYTVMDLAEKAFRSMSAEEGQAEGLKLQGLVDSGAVADDDVAATEMAAELIPLFAGWNGRTQDQVIDGKKKRVRISSQSDSAQRFAALEAAKEMWSKGMLEAKMLKAEQKERRDKMRAEGEADIAKASKLKTRDEQDVFSEKRRSIAGKLSLNIMNIDGFFRWHLGENSNIYRWISDSERKAANAYDDSVRSIAKSVDDWFTARAGSRFAGEKLRFKMAKDRVTITPEKGEVKQMTQLQMITAKLIWRQDDGKRHMKGRKDENGDIVSDWSYGEKFMQQIDDAMSDEAIALFDFLSDAYAAEYESINKVYRKLFGINLPKHLFYAPLTMITETVKDSGSDPVTGFFSGGLSGISGALKSRGTSITEPAFKDALQTYVSHSMQMEHFKAFAELAREAKAIFGRKSFRDQIKRASGEEGVTILNGLLEQLDKGGIRSAALNLETTKLLENLIGRLSTMILFGKLGTVALNITQTAAAAAELGPRRYLVQLSKLLYRPSNWAEAFKSEFIQRRIAEMPAIVRQVQDSQKRLGPSRLADINDKLGYGISTTDGFFTSATYAMIYDLKKQEAKKLGIPADQIEAFAKNEAERITERLAQPTRKGAKSIYENNLGAEGRALFNFISEPRKNMALIAYAFAKNPSKLPGTAMYVILNAMIASVIRAAWQDFREDDEDEDEAIWNPYKLALEIAIDPVYGIPVVGGMLQDLIKASFGFKTFGGTLLESGENAIPAARRMIAMDYDPEEIDRAVSDTNAILGLLGIFDRRLASITAITNVVEDVAKVYDNLTQE